METEAAATIGPSGGGLSVAAITCNVISLSTSRVIPVVRSSDRYPVIHHLKIEYLYH